MDGEILRKLAEFVGMDKERLQRLPANQRNKHFEEFVGFQILKRWHVPDLSKAQLAYVMTGQAGDNQVDSLCILVDGQVVRNEEHAIELLEDADEPSVEYIFIQTTTSTSFTRAKMNEFVVGVENFHAVQNYFGENNALKEKRTLRKAIEDHIGSTTRQSAQSNLYYVALGRWTEEREKDGTEDALGWRKFAADRVQQSSGSSLAPEVEVVDASRLREFIKFNELPPPDVNGEVAVPPAGPEVYARTITAPNLIELPPLDGLAQGYMGYVDAGEYLKLLEREDGLGMLETVSINNVRSFVGMNEVNSEIADTLASPARSQFLLRNNGVTIIARKADYKDRKLRLENYQIVNGLQTSTILHRQRRHVEGGTGVFVPLKIVVTENNALRGAIVRSTNRQTAIEAIQQTGHRPFVRQLRAAFAARRDEPEAERLWLKLEKGEFEDDAGIAEAKRVLSLPDLICAVTATLIRQPHIAAQGEAAMTSKIPSQIFNDAHRHLPYLTASRLLYLTRDWLDHKDDDDLRRCEYHLTFGLMYLAEPYPVPKDFGSQLCEQVCREIEFRLDYAQGVSKALETCAAAIKQIIKPIKRDSREWRDLLRVKKLLTNPLEKRLKGQKGQIRW